MPNRKTKTFSGTSNGSQKDPYHLIFQHSPVAILEKDFSILRKLKIEIERNKVRNIRSYLLKNRVIFNEAIHQIKIQQVNTEALRLYGALSKKELADNFSKTIHRDSFKILADEFTALMTGREYFEAEFKTKSLQGKVYDVILKMNVPEAYKGTFERVIVAIHDVTPQKKIERNLKEKSQTDGLTVVYNHSTILKRLDEEFKRAVRYDKQLSCLMIDLDHFKGINDLCGHQKGDKVLKQSAEKIKQCVREVDIVGRYGGDEFLVILPETPVDKAGIVADRLIRLFDELSKNDNKNEIFSTISIGIGGVPKEGIDTSKMLLADVDKAMYKAKKAGRNTSAVVQL